MAGFQNEKDEIVMRKSRNVTFEQLDIGGFTEPSPEDMTFVLSIIDSLFNRKIR